MFRSFIRSTKGDVYFGTPKGGGYESKTLAEAQQGAESYVSTYPGQFVTGYSAFIVDFDTLKIVKAGVKPPIPIIEWQDSENEEE